MAAGGLSRSVLNDFKHACAISIALAFFLFVVFVDWDPIFHKRSPVSNSAGYEEPSSDLRESRVNRPDWSQESHVESTPIRKLIDDIREATRVASVGVSTELTAAEKEEWHAQNPCRSRSELLPMYEGRKYVKALSSTPRLDAVLAEYSKLHRACMLKVGSNVTHFFVQNKTLPGCKFVVGSPMYGTGLGNKIIVTISALLYAVMTQRILLVPTRTNITVFMCEPFVGSSWALDSSTFPFPDGKKGALPWLPPVPLSKEWVNETQFLSAMDEWIGVEKERNAGTSDLDSLQPPSLKYALSVTVRWQPADRFYCRTEQRMVDEVPWLYWGGCIYSVPKLFASPVFGPVLGALFPDKMVMARVLRSALLPADVVFSKLKEENARSFSRADRRIGIQLRSRQGKDYYTRMNATINQRILDCVVQNGLLANTTSSTGNDDAVPASSSGTKIYIASLYRGLLDYLNHFLLTANSYSGEHVEIVQVSNREEQQLGVEEDIQAFVEILLLSLSDQLLVTPSSTFGSIAQGYGALVPWFIETREDNPTQVFGSCERAQSIDICHQFTQDTFQCPHDPSMDKKFILDNQPSLKRCLNIDHDSGIQLISTFQSDNY